MSLILLFVIPLVMPSVAVIRNGGRMKSLKFASGGHIQFVPDWSPLVSAFSVCAWVKETGTEAYPHFFHYYASGNEIRMAADGNNMYIQSSSSRTSWGSSASISINTWYHICVTWSASSRAFRYYVDTRLVGTKTTTSGRLMKTGGDITIGKNRGTSNSNYFFTGEIAYLNVYAKELTISEITKIVRAGMCKNLAYPDPHESYREIKWENIVQIARSGSVTDVYQEDCIVFMSNILAKLNATNDTSEQLEEVLEEQVALETRLNSTLVELEKISQNLTRSKGKHREASERLEVVLAENRALSKSLVFLTSRLNSTLQELEELSRSMNRTWDWEVFLAEQFINQTFTAEHSEILHSTWDGIAGEIILVICI